MAAVTTLCVVGFPDDVHERELHNLCRWTAGFQEANVAKRTTLFVKFHTRRDAVTALEALNGAPFDAREPSSIMKVEFARREMDVTQPGPVQTTASRKDGSRKRGPEPRKKFLSTGEELKTITVQKLKQKRFTELQLADWFKQLEGFVAIQYSNHADSVFIKFDASETAEMAMIEANGPNAMGAEWARRNLEEDQDGPPHQPAHPPPPAAIAHSDDRPPIARAPRDEDESRRKRARVSAAGEVDTICVLGITGKGLPREELERWFTTRRGFVALNASERADGLFVKFLTPVLAERALETANVPPRNFGAEWARRSLDVDGDPNSKHKPAGPEERHPWTPQPGAGGRGRGDLDTLVVLGLQAKGLKQEKLQQWFQRRPGFLTMHFNERADAVFVKFETPKLADQAISEANWEGYGAEWARRNLDNP